MTYTGYILDERALPDRLRANYHYLRQTEFKCSPTTQGEVIIVEMDSLMDSWYLPSVAEALDELEHSSSLDNFVAGRIREPGPSRKQEILNGIIIIRE